MAGPWESYAGQSTATGPWDDYKPKGSLNESANAFLGGVLEGVPIVGPYIRGGADRLGAGVRSLINGTPYEDELRFVQQRTGQIAEENPITAAGGNVVGAVAGTLPLIAAAPAAFGAGGGSLATRAVASASSGAALGAADTAVRSDFDPNEILKWGSIGGMIGASVPVGGYAVGRGVQAMRNASAARAAAREAGVTPDIAEILARTATADNALGAPGQIAMARAGDSAMLADVGPATRSVLDTSIQRGGPGAIVARDRIGARVSSDSDALVAALNQSMGAPEGVTAARTAIREGSAGARSATYRAAYEQPIDYASEAGQRLEAMVRGRVPPSALKAANDLMRIEGVQSQQILAKVADDGSVVFERLPDVQQLDYLTRGLNQVAESAEGQGALGKTTTMGRAYGNLARDIRDELRALVPEYDTALQTAADPIRRSQAVELGSRVLSPSMTRDQVAEAVQGMTKPEKAALASGIRSQIDDAMARVTRTVQDGDVGAREAVQALKSLSSRSNREKLSLALGEQQTDALFKELDRVATSFDLRAGVADNSRTYARAAAEQSIRDIAAPGPIGTLAQGNPIPAGRQVLQALTRQTPAAVKSKEDAAFAAIAEALTRTGPGATSLQKALTAYEAARGNRGIDEIAALLARATISASPRAASQQLGAR